MGQAVGLENNSVSNMLKCPCSPLPGSVALSRPSLGAPKAGRTASSSGPQAGRRQGGLGNESHVHLPAPLPDSDLTSKRPEP